MAKLPLHEFRRLTLPIETAVDVVLELDSEQGGSLAHGTLVEAQIETEPEAGLVVVARRRGSETPERRKFTLPAIAAALIRYCWKCRIPLPRAGSKRIDITPEGFVFTIEGTVEVVRRHGALPQPRPAIAAVPTPATEPGAVTEPAEATESAAATEPDTPDAPARADSPEAGADPAGAPPLVARAEALAVAEPA
ncbi:MAG TPA: hypothetical protein VMU67_03360 [Steroidobacteraceae bacterium]|nr:hypothetical protein [Steroidobacteraceae bacterium]